MDREGEEAEAAVAFEVEEGGARLEATSRSSRTKKFLDDEYSHGIWGLKQNGGAEVSKVHFCQ